MGLGTATAALTGSRTPANKPPTPPNILFLLTDQHRQDGVGAYGKEGVITPHLDGLARDGIRFDRAYTAQPVCAPNRASILSGLYPHTHGLRENTWPLSPRVQTMAEMLAPLGYDCGYFGKWHLGRQDAQGFRTFPEYPSDGRGEQHFFSIAGEKRYSTDVITDDVLAFIQQERASPFYAYVSYYPPHPPYSVPEPYENLYRDRFPGDRRRRIYYAMCTKVDEQIGRLLAALDARGLAENTLVVFTTEHGHFFEPRWNDHEKRLCYDTAARVPLLMRLPGVIPAHQTTPELISAVDLVQTMMGLVGMPAPEALQGEDLSGLARGREDARRAAIFMENFPLINKTTARGPYRNEPEWEAGEERCVRDRSWKLILSTTRPPELYHMEEDPGETNNRWARMHRTPEVKRLRDLLHDWAIRTGDSIAPALLARL